MSNARNLPCIHCGKPRADHHEYESKELPAGCVCSPGEWLVEEVPPACEEFEPMDVESDICAHCEHEEPCHKAKGGGA